MILGIQPTLFGIRGSTARPGVSTILKKSFVYYEQDIEPEMDWDGAIRLMLNRMGGVDRVMKAIQSVSPEIIHFSIALPVRSSEEQEDGFLSSESLLTIGNMGASFGLSFP